MKYVIPQEKICKKMEKKAGKFIWEPIILLKYRASKEKTVIFDAFLPDLQKQESMIPFARLLLARDAARFKSSHDCPIEAYKLTHKTDVNKLVRDLYAARERVTAILESEKKKFEVSLQEDFNVLVEWEKFRFLLIPPQRSTFGRVFSAGKEIKNIEIFIVKDILEVGLGILPNSSIDVIEYEYAYYPLFITKDLTVYEVAYKKDPSNSYSTMIQSDEDIKKIYQKVIE